MSTSVGKDPRSLERRIYHLVVRDPHLSVRELATRLEAEPGQVESSLDALRRLGLLRSVGDEGMLPLGPEAAITDLLREQNHLVRRMGDRFAETRSALAELSENYLQLTSVWRSPIEVEILRAPDDVERKLEELALLNQHDLLSMQPGGNRDERYVVSRPHDLAALGRGVRYRLLVQPVALRSPVALRYLDEIAEAGADVRVAQVIPLKLLIIDDVIALSPSIDERGETAGALAVYSAPLVRMLRTVFEQVWSTATTYDSAPRNARRAPGNGLTDQQRTILRLLAAGAKDEAIARQVGVSDRTVSRVVSDLLDELGATSRFAAGVRAAQLGWLTEDSAASGPGRSLLGPPVGRDRARRMERVNGVGQPAARERAGRPGTAAGSRGPS